MGELRCTYIVVKVIKKELSNNDRCGRWPTALLAHFSPHHLVHCVGRIAATGRLPSTPRWKSAGGRRLATGGSVEAAALVAEMHLLRLLPSLDFNVIFLVALLK